MTFILSFIEHAFKRGFYDGSIVGTISPAEQDRHVSTDVDHPSYTHRDRGVALGLSSGKLLPRQTHDDTIRVIRREELQQLVRWAGPRPVERIAESAGSERDFILFALGWAVGLRAAEILGLTIYPFEGIVVDPAHLGEHFRIKVAGKGNKVRAVDVPAWLIQDIQAYIGGERRRVLSRRGRRVHEAQLLLNGEMAKSHMGKPIGKSGLDLIIKRACNDCGLTERTERTNPETGEIAALSRPKYSLHCLRHTYAVMTYHNMASAGFDDLERWKYIQLQLGHAQPKTSLDYYLRHVSTWSSRRVASALSELFG